uniref:Uncharacterized protein MANES_01G134100 n=1 Tax=Rhizophora mucronata TaxID=61149 RepID=A0A2P2J8Y9_RHIMU
MDRGKKPSTFMTNRNCKIYMDLKDIIREHTLPFLPGKSLHRCSSVCRDWKLQISSPFFAHNQSNSFRDISGFFCQTPSGLPSFLSLNALAYGVPDPSLKFLPEPVDIRCSCNGLLCCQGRAGCKAYYICNPVMQQWKKIPQPTADHGPDPALVLVFEPSLLNFVAEYKLICAFPSDLDGYEFEIYSSAEGSWKISGEICFGNRQIMPRTGVHADGIIYWLSRHNGIVAFDLKSERSTLHYSYLHGTLGQMDGKLHCASMRGANLTIAELSNSYTNTMEMHSKTKAWDVKLEVALNNSMIHQGNVLFVGGNVVLIQSGNSVVCVDMKTKGATILATEVDTSTRMVPYVNSLVEL